MAVAVDSVIFGFDGEQIRLLLIHRGFKPEKNKWSLMGGFVQEKESLENAATRILKQLTGLEGVYMEQVQVFGEPDRDPVERTISVVYYSLIDIGKYKKQLSADYRPEWFALDELPDLIFDHNRMVQTALERLRYKAALHPILFELLPEKFTIRELFTLYQAVYGKELDKRNFIRKLNDTGLLIRQKEKETSTSKKGSFYYKLNKRKYLANVNAFISLMPSRALFR
jgi:ADP-ribose pyrophosphatase YjhB (NUDIX family)